MKPIFNMSKAFDDGGYSIYLPAMSSFYVKQIANANKDDNFHKKERVPNTLEHGIGGLDFLKRDGSYYHYKYGLYSAGHAQLDLSKAVIEEEMVHCRDRDNTMILGDSGGFQVAKGIIKLDWTNAGRWAKYDNKTQIPGWKAYILNPRVTYKDADNFTDNLKKLASEYEYK